MTDANEHIDDVQAHFFDGPTWDEEEVDDVAEEPSDDGGDDDVEAHAGGGFNRPT
jgi:hypothetical protein